MVTGGAGFVGSNLAIQFKELMPDTKVVSLDNLRRRGSELTLPRLRDAGVEFFHGDIRNIEDITDAGAFDLLVDCSAEPSVHSGYNSDPGYLLNTNLVATTHCLEAARKCGADILFMSTSRVYPIATLRDLPLQTTGSRLDIAEDQFGPGWSHDGITADFPLAGARSLYGATKLASELLITEYVSMYGLRAVINRCGVLTGPWQMGKVDQGFVVLWAARHLYGGPLSYNGFGGHGHQVRDILHVRDLFSLLTKQLACLDEVNGDIYNVGGGLPVSVSLAELTDICERLSGNTIDISQNPVTADADIPYYVTDNRITSDRFSWHPQTTAEGILEEVFRWLHDHQDMLQPILGKSG